MPEGDTIFRAARTLHRALAGKAVVRFESAYPALTRIHHDAPVIGRTIEGVSAAGKHLLMTFSGGLVLRTHMRMNGSWHVYRPGEPWQRPRSDMRIVIETADFVAVGFNVPVAEFVAADRLARHPELRRLGPDPLAENFDEQEALDRMQLHADEPIGDVLIDQSVMAGVGNVYKSEILFACGVYPFIAVRQLDSAALRCLIATARRFLVANVRARGPYMTTYTGFRRTTSRDNAQERLWVYGRAARPCRRCGSAINATKTGTAARVTYWCPVCQRPSA